MKRSSTSIFAFLFFFLVVGAGATIGGVFGFDGPSAPEVIQGSGKKEVKNEDDSKIKEAEKGLLYLVSDKEETESLEESKPLNVGIELTKALFGKYLKKEE